MNPKRLLIVEDELLIAHTISNYLQEKNYFIVDICITVDEAIKVLKNNDVDIVLIDIILYGSKTGIDLAHSINKNFKLPFVYLTSQLDDYFINQAKITSPNGYLTKPIQKESLFSTLEMISLNPESISKKDSIYIKENRITYKLKVSEILFIKSDHVYLEIYYLNKEKPYIIRQSLQNIALQICDFSFIQCHKTFLVNVEHIESWSTNTLIINTTEIPISRNRRSQIQEKLKSWSSTY